MASRGDGNRHHGHTSRSAAPPPPPPPVGAPRVETGDRHGGHHHRNRSDGHRHHHDGHRHHHHHHGSTSGVVSVGSHIHHGHSHGHGHTHSHRSDHRSRHRDHGHPAPPPPPPPPSEAAPPTSASPARDPGGDVGADRNRRVEHEHLLATGDTTLALYHSPTSGGAEAAGASASSSGRRRRRRETPPSSGSTRRAGKHVRGHGDVVPYDPAGAGDSEYVPPALRREIRALRADLQDAGNEIHANFDVLADQKAALADAQKQVDKAAAVHKAKQKAVNTVRRKHDELLGMFDVLSQRALSRNALTFREMHEVSVRLQRAVAECGLDVGAGPAAQAALRSRPSWNAHHDPAAVTALMRGGGKGKRGAKTKKGKKRTGGGAGLDLFSPLGPGGAGSHGHGHRHGHRHGHAHGYAGYDDEYGSSDGEYDRDGHPPRRRGVHRDGDGSDRDYDYDDDGGGGGGDEGGRGDDGTDAAEEAAAGGWFFGEERGVRSPSNGGRIARPGADDDGNGSGSGSGDGSLSPRARDLRRKLREVWHKNKGWLRRGIMRFQAVVRGASVRQEYSKIPTTIIWMQYRWRQRVKRRLRQRHRHAATLMQSRIRGYQARKRTQSILPAVTRVQAAWRGRQERVSMRKAMRGIVRIQARLRGRAERLRNGADERRRLLRRLREPTPENLRLFFHEIDANGGGTISLAEFLAALRKYNRSLTDVKRDEIKRRASVKDGTYTELAGSLRTQMAVFTAADFDASGELDVEEFVSAFSGTKDGAIRDWLQDTLARRHRRLEEEGGDAAFAAGAGAGAGGEGGAETAEVVAERARAAEQNKRRINALFENLCGPDNDVLTMSGFLAALQSTQADSVLTGDLSVQLQLFGKLDTDGSGEITRDEFLETMCTTEDPTLISWMFSMLMPGSGAAFGARGPRGRSSTLRHSEETPRPSLVGSGNSIVPSRRTSMRAAELKPQPRRRGRTIF